MALNLDLRKILKSDLQFLVYVIKTSLLSGKPTCICQRCAQELGRIWTGRTWEKGGEHLTEGRVQ